MSFVASFLRSRRCSKGRADRERGWALVSVLWAITMLALMAAATEALTVTSYRSERHAMIDARAVAVLDATVAGAALGISDIRPGRRWRTDGATTRFTFDGVQARVAVQDQHGCIDLNAASGATIHQLLIGQGLPRDRAEALTDSILEWRSKAGLEGLKGATGADYRAARRGYAPRHGPFETVEELKLVIGMTPELFEKVGPALTVYSKLAAADATVAPRAVLAALYPGDTDRVEQILRARDGDPQATMQLGYAKGTSPATPVGHAYRITAEIRLGTRKFVRDAVIELTGDDKRPYFVLAWR